MGMTWHDPVQATVWMMGLGGVTLGVWLQWVRRG